MHAHTRTHTHTHLSEHEHDGLCLEVAGSQGGGAKLGELRGPLEGQHLGGGEVRGEDTRETG